MSSTTIPGFTPTTAGSTTTNPSGISGMTGADFMKVMIAQLQHQDPLDPSKSDELLTQMSQISQLQSNQAMQTNIEGLTLQQSIGAGGNLIGKTVVGLDSTGTQVSGVVTSITVADKVVSLTLDSGGALPLSSVTQIAPTSGQSANAASPNTQSTAMQAVLATPQVQGLLSSLGISGSQLTPSQLTQILSSPQAQAYFNSAASASAASSSSGPTPPSISSLLGMLGL